MIPLGLLVFAIPLPYFLEATLTADLQLISTRLGVAFIRFFDIPVDPLSARKVLASHFLNDVKFRNAVVVSPDVGKQK